MVGKSLPGSDWFRGECSSGGKSTLLGMRGDAYLRTLLIHGARSAILAAQRRSKQTNI